MDTHLAQTEALPWLLEPDPANPGVRYFALRELVGRPADDPEVRQARRDAMTSGPIPAILDAQHPEGYWVKPGAGYSPKYQGSVWQIILLAELGADPADERVRQGCDYLLRHNLAVTGGFSANRLSAPSGVLHCLNGNLVHALIQLGFADDPRVQTAVTWQAQAIVGHEAITYYASGTSGPGFACGVNGMLPCAWGANKAMKALSAIPPAQRTPLVQQAIALGVEFLFSRDPAVADYPTSDQVSGTWFKLGFPLSYWSDVLETAAVLAEVGYGNDPRLDPAIQFILDKQVAPGRWKLENSLNRKMWLDIEKRGKPSKWVTLRVMRLLQRRAPVGEAEVPQHDTTGDHRPVAH